VAPLTATVLATVAAGALALARSERERRRARARRARERRFALIEGEETAAGVKRMALAQLDRAIELLQGESGLSEKHAIHEARKALKRLRALLRLLRGQLGERAFAREDAVLHDAARRLAGARDAQVMVDTLDKLLERRARGLARQGGVVELRAQLAAERDSAELALGDPGGRAATLNDLRAARLRVATWRLPAHKGLRLVEPGLRDLYRQGARRRRHAIRGKAGDTRVLHRWRKRVKDLRYAAQALGLAQLARRADALQETLGQEHDLALLATRVGASDGPLAGRGKRRKRTRKALLKLIATRRERLRKQALREGERLYRRAPKRFAKHVRRLHAQKT
jgi:CHAD domain-containing protein